ncbi:hypothetical protein BC567DRAFT_233675 [Phyllosticta citribraziliensis]
MAENLWQMQPRKGCEFKFFSHDLPPKIFVTLWPLSRHPGRSLQSSVVSVRTRQPAKQEAPEGNRDATPISTTSPHHHPSSNSTSEPPSPTPLWRRRHVGRIAGRGISRWPCCCACSDGGTGADPGKMPRSPSHVAISSSPRNRPSYLVLISLIRGKGKRLTVSSVFVRARRRRRRQRPRASSTCRPDPVTFNACWRLFMTILLPTYCHLKQSRRIQKIINATLNNLVGLPRLRLRQSLVS